MTIASLIISTLTIGIALYTIRMSRQTTRYRQRAEAARDDSAASQRRAEAARDELRRMRAQDNA